MYRAGMDTEGDLVELAERAAYEYGPDRERLQSELRRRADSVVAQFEELLTLDPARAARLAAALAAFWGDIGRVDDGRRLTAAAITRVEAAGAAPGRVAAAQLAMAELAFRQGDQAAATRHAGIAIDLGDAADDVRTRALAHLILARVAYRAGDAAAIEAQVRTARAIAPDEPSVQRGSVHMLAWAAHTAGDVELARARFLESIALRTSQGDRFGVSVEVANLGDLAAEHGDIVTAATYLLQALDVAIELDSRYLILNLLPSLAVLAAGAGDDDAAARLIGAAEGVGERSGLVPDPGAWQPALDDAERRLGARFATLRADGRALELSEALELARRTASSLRAASRD